MRVVSLNVNPSGSDSGVNVKVVRGVRRVMV